MENLLDKLDKEERTSTISKLSNNKSDLLNFNKEEDQISKKILFIYYL